MDTIAHPPVITRSFGWKRIAVRVLGEPFRAMTWRRLAYLVLALPVGLLCVPIALVGGPAGRIQRGLARSLLGAEVAAQAPVAGRARAPLAFVHAVLSAAVNLVAIAVCGYFWTIVVINLGYPLRTDTTAESLTHSWGGPSLAGAWAVHAAAGGLPFLFLTPWVMRGFNALQTGLIRAFLSDPAPGGAHASGGLTRGRAVVLALGVCAVCAALSVPVIHQL
ncbi:hypothetical protein [Streptomyces montanisoli]|uniref:Sensor domain-containing protein n=1 Tax=Streptomyces montanisoli TaxID=2798581 RepID=A0A940RX40_9ACTN|nr:hypothetical protein [Streptomyces montanisoli]MBP0459921.1 hypothetical protein [Streptomyces montanisoli]